jgi:hypothetical protein
MKRIVVVLALVVLAGSSSPAPAAAAAGDTYYPLGKNYKWVYSTDYSEDTELVHEVTGTEKVGDTECFIVEHKTVSPALGSRMMRKEWLASNTDGVLIHKLQRGRSEMEVAKPFFKVKHLMRKDEEWKGEAKASENPPQYTIRVEEEVDVEVPAGKYKAWKVNVKIESGLRHSAEGTEWYVKNVGLVKAQLTIRAGGDEFTLGTELKKFETGK